MANDFIVRCPLTPPTKFIPREDIGTSLFKALRRAQPHNNVMVNVFEDESITFSAFADRAEIIARHLLSRECKKHDVIALYSSNSIAWALMMAAATRIGATFAGVNHMLTAGELAYQLKLCNAKYVFVSQELASNVAEIRNSTNVQEVFVKGEYQGCVSFKTLLVELSNLPSLPPLGHLGLKEQDVAAILFSSGTTGPQKAVMITHRNLQGSAVVCNDSELKFGSHNQVVFAPFAHLSGYLTILCALLEGFTSNVLSRFDLELYISLVAKYKLSAMFVVPTVAVMLTKRIDLTRYDLTSIKDILCGSAPLSHEMETTLMQKFPGARVRQGYGMTETSAICTFVPFSSTRIKTGSVGVPMYNVEMKVVDPETGRALGADQAGEFLTKSPTIMLGYANNEKATREAIDADGWLHTGDIGYYDKDGYFYIIDRLKELIKYKGLQVAPAELESVLLSHPQIADAGVIGTPDLEAGELPLAWVVKKVNASGLTEKDVIDYVAGKVAPHKYLRGGVRFVDEIPRSASGKIMRREMRQAIAVNKSKL